MDWCVCVMLAHSILRYVDANQSAPNKKTVAILLTGHARTFNLTAPTLRSMLVDVNSQFDFFVFALAYRNGQRKPTLTSNLQPPVLTNYITPKILRATYKQVVPLDRLTVHVVSERAVEKLLPKQLRSPSEDASRHEKARAMISMMFRMISSAHSMVRDYEVNYRRRFDVILKLRFDLALLRAFILKPALVAPNRTAPQSKHLWLPIVVPEKMAPGDSQYLLNQLRTRPCDIDGLLKPRWCATRNYLRSVVYTSL